MRAILRRHRKLSVLESAWLPTSPPTGLWYLSPQTARARGIKPVTSAVVAGGFTAYHMAVNDVGIAFVRAARTRGDDPDAIGWTNEAGLNGNGAVRRRPVADSLLHYQVNRNGAGPLLLTVAIELDRATTPIQRLVDKLITYSKLRANPDAWQHRLAVWPALVTIFAGKPRPVLQRRMTTLIGALRNDPRTHDLELVPVLLGLFEDLMGAGPFAPVFRSIEAPEVSVDVLGRSDS
jgi:protein involved in plasmid replication-relaxation